jgi:hypothetical protein
MNLLISFSGGKTSAYMAYKLLYSDLSRYDEVLVVFANTGREHEKTMSFVMRCDEAFDMGLLWVEAEVNGPDIGTGFRLTNYKSADREGARFEEVIQKYGISNKSYPHCNRELKLAPIHAYVESLGWKKGEYETAVGIRDDEPRRVSRGGKYNIIYPLIDIWPTDKVDVNQFWESMSFNLEIPEHLGNCVGCWKKSEKKLAMVQRDAPEIFDWTRKMEQGYGHIGLHHDRVFFRENRNTDQLLKYVEIYKPFLDQIELFADEDDGGGCSESCEVYPMEDIS